ncbi:gypsy retrotransposon integrase-like protein 1 [Plakobranchus ocellatus]|uniref:Gypsy retrotransposon integrase-like protein 1 n=1 Tax=Plakobranchus ocellatus TaxID=259542 RepID=A0AAV4A8Y6_9GAST|nr:gypsy retrotransposon integrase-like protein 1 [Plakobranchus ocellatus]
MAHDSPSSGHTGFRKTLAHVKSEYSWPGFTSDVYQFVRSCHTCKIKTPVGRNSPAPLQSMSSILEPFHRVVIDLIGPLPCTYSKNMYVLTLIDMATRWAEAVPLRSISSQHVTESLFQIFTRVGFPVEIPSDRETQFISELFAEFAKLAGVKHLFSTRYHPQTNGVVEGLHSTLKAMLGKLSAHNPAEWDKYLGAVLFAYRQQPHSSTGFSPFFLLFAKSINDAVRRWRIDYPPSGSDSDYAPAHVDSVVEIVDVCSAGVISEEQGTELGCEMTTVPEVQFHSQVLINPDLQPHQRGDVHRVLVDFADVLTSRPGHTKTMEPVIRLQSDKVIRMKPYSLPFAS